MTNAVVCDIARRTVRLYCGDMSPKPPMIQLWESIGFGIIISFSSGIHYSNQTGGTACLHPSLEGVYVPLGNDCTHPEGKLLSPETELFNYFGGPNHRGTGAVAGLDEADATFIESMLVRWKFSSFLTLDHTRLKDSHEAWVWANLIGESNDLFSGLGPYPRSVVLTWTNTD